MLRVRRPQGGRPASSSVARGVLMLNYDARQAGRLLLPSLESRLRRLPSSDGHGRPAVHAPLSYHGFYALARFIFLFLFYRRASRPPRSETGAWPSFVKAKHRRPMPWFPKQFSHLTESQFPFASIFRAASSFVMIAPPSVHRIHARYATRRPRILSARRGRVHQAGSAATSQRSAFRT